MSLTLAVALPSVIRGPRLDFMPLKRNPVSRVCPASTKTLGRNGAMKKVAAAIAILLSTPVSANADVFVTGRVTMLEASYLPNVAGFFLDNGYSGCPAGSYLQWRGPNNDGNPNVVLPGFDMLTAAVVNRATVGVSFSSGCTVHLLYLEPPAASDRH